MSRIISLQNSYNNYPPLKSIPIQIPNSLSYSNLLDNSNYNLSKDTFDNLYCFNLKIITNTNIEQVFTISNNKEFANLIKNHQQVNYDNLKEYRISIFHKEKYFILEGKINNELSSFVDKNDNIFIEFSQDSYGNTNCICYFLNKNINNLCVSPPN